MKEQGGYITAGRDPEQRNSVMIADKKKFGDTAVSDHTVMMSQEPGTYEGPAEKSSWH